MILDLNYILVTSRKIEEEEEVDSESIFSSSCHVFMTEIMTSEAEIQRRASAFQIEPTKLEETNEYKEFPNNADPIINTIEGMILKLRQEFL